MTISKAVTRRRWADWLPLLVDTRRRMDAGHPTPPDERSGCTSERIPCRLRRKGFTLVEVMVSMAILGVGSLATIGIMTMSIQRAVTARKLTTAQQLGQDILERLRAEVRYDGIRISNPNLPAQDAWKFDVLPHGIGTTAGAGCQPDGLDDGVEYGYGPYVFRREDQDYRVCYRLLLIGSADLDRANLPDGTTDARVRVLWTRPDGGWASWAMSDLLVTGRAL